jgi:hypothetical protein
MRRRLYLALVATGFLLWVVLGGRFGVGYLDPRVQVLVLISFGLAVAGLRWLEPRRLPYMLGAACMALACAAGWLGGPDGPLRADRF